MLVCIMIPEIFLDRGNEFYVRKPDVNLNNT